MTAPLLLLALSLVSDPDTTLHLRRNGAVTIDTRMRDIMVRTGPTNVVTVHGAGAARVNVDVFNGDVVVKKKP